MAPRTTCSARAKWGNTSFRQLIKNIADGDTFSSIFSGFLLQGDGTAINVTITEAFNGASFAFDSNGGNISITLPDGEQTQDGLTVVSISGFGSLTKVNGEWLYVGQ